MKPTQMLRQLTLQVSPCARCGMDHLLVIFLAFEFPIVEQDGTEWEYWGQCPVSLAPLLARSVWQDDSEKFLLEST